MNVFIADDSSILRERLVAMLTEIPLVNIVGTAQDGVESTERILKIRPELAVLDIRMPKRNGIHVLRAVKLARPETQIIMLTNYPYPQYQKKCLDEGAEYFFNKYTDFEKVVEVIADLASQMEDRTNRQVDLD